jgi:hypothetical protein
LSNASACLFNLPLLQETSGAIKRRNERAADDSRSVQCGSEIGDLLIRLTNEQVSAPLDESNTRPDEDAFGVANERTHFIGQSSAFGVDVTHALLSPVQR